MDKAIVIVGTTVVVGSVIGFVATLLIIRGMMQ